MGPDLPFPLFVLHTAERWRSAASLCARVALGALFVFSGIGKLATPALFQSAVANYRVLPLWAVGPVAGLVAWSEVVLGAMLLCGLMTRVSAAALLCLLAVFTVAMASAAVRGIDISCGCFGADSQSISWLSFSRNALLMALTLWIARRERTPLAMDSTLARLPGHLAQAAILLGLLLLGGSAMWQMGPNPAPPTASAVRPEGLVAMRRRQSAERVRLDLFTMSNCPFGLAAEHLIFRRLLPTGAPVDVHVHFIAEDSQASPELVSNPTIAAHRYDTGCHSNAFSGTGRFRSLHGEEEVQEDIRQVVVQRYWPERLGDYALRRAESRLANDWRADAQEVGLDPAAIQAVIDSGEGERLMAENIATAQRLGIRSSPTLFINGEMMTEPLYDTNLFRAVAAALADPADRAALVASLPPQQARVRRSGGLTCVQAGEGGVWLCCPSVDDTGRDEMALVPDPTRQGRYLCVDRFEASLDGHTEPLASAEAVSAEIAAGRAIAVSLRGVVPQAHVSEVMARRMCEAAGKRLCSYEEWRFACAGPNSEPFPYGTDYRPGACHDGGGQALLTGMAPECVRRFEVLGQPGLSEIYDLIGNLSEWTRGRLMENSLALDHAQGLITCDSAVERPMDWSAADAGFRCCADAVVMTDAAM